MTDIDRAALRALAEAATPGPWHTGTGEHWSRDVRCRDPEGLAAGGQGVAWCGGEHGHEDAEYIAAASPDVVLALLDERAAAIARADRLESALRALVEVSVRVYPQTWRAYDAARAVLGEGKR